MTGAYQNIDWGFQKNPRFKQVFYSVWGNNNHYMKHLDNLVESLRNNHVQGIEEKLSDVSDIDKFRSTVSELEVASIIRQQHKEVELLPDAIWTGASPDISSKNASEVLIEVKRITEDEAVDLIRNQLQQFLAPKLNKISVHVRLGGKLSVPVVKRPERLQKESLARESVEQFKSKFDEAVKKQLPAEIQTDAATYVLKPSYFQGFGGILVSRGYAVPQKDLIEKLVDDVCDKAAKRASFPNAKKNCPYVIAIDTEQPSIDDFILERAFIGDSVYQPEGDLPTVPVSTEVKRAISMGWEHFLRRSHVLQEDRSYLPAENTGAFFTKGDMKNVSLILLRRDNASVDLLPNPFCEDAINDPSIMNFLK